jgi:hypothetical protein
VRVCVYGGGVSAQARACTLNNPARNPPPYCHMRPLWLHHISRHYIINCKIFREKVIKHNVYLHFLYNTQISSFVKICPVGAEMFTADGHSDMTKLTVVFRNFVYAPKTNYQGLLVQVFVLWPPNLQQNYAFHLWKYMPPYRRRRLTPPYIHTEQHFSYGATPRYQRHFARKQASQVLTARAGGLEEVDIVQGEPEV